MFDESPVFLAPAGRWAQKGWVPRGLNFDQKTGHALTMQIYLPIAEMSLNALLLLGLGGMVGFLSGMFGVGGGFLMTPLLIFIGVPPAVAVGTEANQVVAASVSGALAHWRRGNVDVRMGVVLLVGGFIGSTLGVWLFTFLRSIGQIDFVIAVAYVLFLGSSAC